MNSRDAIGNRLAVVRGLAAAILMLPVFLFAAPSAFAQTDAKSILAGVYQQDTSRDVTLRATLEVTAKDGKSQKKRFVLRRIGKFGNGKTLVRFTEPQDIRGVALLSVHDPGAPVQQWIYTPATERVRSVSPRERSERFAGSDFTYEDIVERPLDDFTYQLLEAQDTFENHRTSKILATPVSPDRSQYKYIYYWVAQDVPCILHAEMYGQDGQELREMHATGLRKESGMWGARRTEMRTVPDGTKSLLTIDELHLNTGLDEALFTPEALEKNPREKSGEPERK